MDPDWRCHRLTALEVDLGMFGHWRTSDKHSTSGWIGITNGLFRQASTKTTRLSR